MFSEQNHSKVCLHVCYRHEEKFFMNALFINIYIKEGTDTNLNKLCSAYSEQAVIDSSGSRQRRAGQGQPGTRELWAGALFCAGPGPVSCLKTPLKDNRLSEKRSPITQTSGETSYQRTESIKLSCQETTKVTESKCQTTLTPTQSQKHMTEDILQMTYTERNRATASLRSLF